MFSYEIFTKDYIFHFYICLWTYLKLRQLYKLYIIQYIMQFLVHLYTNILNIVQKKNIQNILYLNKSSIIIYTCHWICCTTMLIQFNNCSFKISSSQLFLWRMEWLWLANLITAVVIKPDYRVRYSLSLRLYNFKICFLIGKRMIN